MEAFGCSRYKVDQARKLSSNNSGLVIPSVTKTVVRSRLNQDKVEHFLEFIFTSGLLRDVAYGVTKIKFDSGDEQKVAHAVLIAKRSHTIAFYNQICKNDNYTPLSESSLWRILHAIKPSQRKSLAGLDDITAAGMNGFSTLQDLATKFKNTELKDQLERGKRYLKTNYQTRCSANEPGVNSHCPYFALSDESDNMLQQNSFASPDSSCNDCFSLNHSMNEIRRFAVDNASDNDTMYDIDIAIKDIIDYIKHLMRDCQQKKAKTHAFNSLDNETAFWLKDFCQKVIPTRFREGQKEYFGKKGMSLHVDVIFTKKNNVLCKKVYFTALYRCDQGLADTLAIANLVIDQFKIDEPGITKIFAKSDNASSYHGNYIMEALHHLCKEKKLKLLRYDYNEPCRGKDQCDREAAGAKSIMRSFVDAGKDLLTAEDMHSALHYGDGMKNSAIAVACVDGKSILDGTKTNKISQYHSFEFFDDYMVMWRYFGVGTGVVYKYNKVFYDLKVTLIIPFSNTDAGIRDDRREQPKKQIRQDRLINNLHFCTEHGCSGAFTRATELEEHLLSGQHQINTIDSGMDRVKQSFINKMQSTSSLHFNQSAISSTKIYP